MTAQVTAREMRETVTTFDNDDTALLFAVRESLRLLGIHCEVVLSDGRRVKVWTWDGSEVCYGPFVSRDVANMLQFAGFAGGKVERVSIYEVEQP